MPWLRQMQINLFVLHALQGPNPQSRQQVESLRVQTPKYGEQRLDAEPDKRLVRSDHTGAPSQQVVLSPAGMRLQALVLSSELNLDEVLAVQFLITASQAGAVDTFPRFSLHVYLPHYVPPSLRVYLPHLKRELEVRR
jgi:hypothetical protein